MLTCDQVRELEAGYALGILTASEQPAVREHLSTCDRHPVLGEMRAAAEALAYTVEERMPGAALRSRVLAHEGSGSGHEISGRRVPWWLLRSVAAVLVIAAVAAIVGVAWPNGDEEDLFVKSFTTQGDIEVELVVDFSQASSTVTFAHLPVLQAGQEYSTWAIRDGAWLKMGSFRANAEGWWSGEFAFRMQPGDLLCLTGGGPIDEYAEQTAPLFIEPL